MKRKSVHRSSVGLWKPLIIIGLLEWGGMSGTYWESVSAAQTGPIGPSNFSSVLTPGREDIPFFNAIAEDQEKKLNLCKNEDECRPVHFLRALAALYENPELAALHFRKVVASGPNSALASESRFWLWLLEVLTTPGRDSMTSQDFIRRLVREIVEKELLIHELSGKLENASVETLQQELTAREKAVEELKLMVANLSKQTEQFKKEQTIRQDVQQELKASEKKVQELTNQLEALRRIDQEIREKAPPTRPSEKMTPNPDLEKNGEKDLKYDGEGKK